MHLFLYLLYQEPRQLIQIRCLNLGTEDFGNIITILLINFSSSGKN